MTTGKDGGKVKQYVLVDDKTKFSCKECQFRNCENCEGGKHFELNPDWKPASQRVRELTGKLSFGSDVYYNFRDLANELEQEETEQWAKT